jgi:rod shape determining protein RodA
MARRSWRNFDYLLLGALLALSAYGAVMVYSATIDTLGVENPLQRQLIFIAAGTAVLLVTASVDYRLLELIQHPFAALTPVVLGLGSVALVTSWRASQMPIAESPPAASQFAPDLPVMVAGMVIVFVVFVIDRAWVEKLDLQMPRLVAIATVVGAIVVGLYLLSQQEAEHRQALTPVVIVGGMAAGYLLDCLTLRFTDTLRNPIYVFALAILGIILVIGQVAGGSQRWLGAGQVQPSELSKIIVIVILAKFLADREDRLDQIGTVVISMGIITLPMILIYLQPDLGTALTLLAIWAAMMWMYGTRFRHLAVLVAAGVAILPLVWFGLADYMRDRILLFVNPAGDPDSYFNVYQSLVSIGSGGWVGKGLTHGTQSQLHFLRVRHTDFIFAVAAEELGFVGAVAMILLILFLLWRTLHVAAKSRDAFGRLIAAGMVGVILFQSVVNIGMNLGLMPVTGIPLPFVSYGGSSYLTLMVGMGLVESVAMRHKKLEFD